MPRPRSRCTPQKKKLPKYKLLARNLPAGSVETLERFRYKVDPDNPGRPCRVVDDQAPGRTACYAPTAHSTRRKTCQMLVHPEDVVPDVVPGLYLYGSPRFQKKGPHFTCRSVDDMYSMKTRRHTDDSQAGSFFVLGPYKDPSTGRLLVRCSDIGVFSDHNSLRDVRNLGNCFLHFDGNHRPERVTPVPTPDMLRDAAKDCEWAHGAYQRGEIAHTDVPWTMLGGVFEQVAQFLEDCERHRQLFDLWCEGAPAFERKMRRLARMCWDFSMYGRQWAGPCRKLPTAQLAGYVHADPTNPLDPKIVGGFVRATADGVKLSKKEGDGAPADYSESHGMLTNMVYAAAESIVLLYESLDTTERELCRSVWLMGLNYWMIDDSGYWVSKQEINYSNGNGNHAPMDVFTQMGGTPTGRSGLVARSSVTTGEYCVQIASSHLGRMVLTLIPYLYKSRPAWSRGDGMDQFPSLHT